MATLNPVGVVRDIQSSPNNSRQIHDIVGRFAGGGTNTVTVETKLTSILAALIENETDGTMVAPTIGDSTTYVGTKTVAFAVAVDKVYTYRITGHFALTSTVDAAADADATITYEPIKGV